MSYDEGLATRQREFCLMVRGHTTVGVVKETFMARTGKEAHAEALARGHARPMDFTGRALEGMVYV
jgi:hypothetical protein